MFYYIIQIQINALKNVPINKCNSKYLFVAGFTQKEQNENILSYTKNNFKKCVKSFIK
jgi:hypothetical protein